MTVYFHHITTIDDESLGVIVYKAAWFELAGDDEMTMEYDIFGRYERKRGEEKSEFVGPKTEDGGRPTISFEVAADGKPT